MIHEFVDTIALALANAAQSAEAGTLKSQANKRTGTTVRASRIGLPLLQLVLEDLVLPDERLEGVNKSDMNPKPRVQLPTMMRIATGHLFEAAYLQELQARYGVANVVHNGELSCVTPAGINISGTYDFIVMNEETNVIELHECKALNVFGQKEAEDKLLTNNWGYLTQLALYSKALQVAFPHMQVQSKWIVWCKKLERVLEVPFPMEQVDELVNEAGENARVFLLVQQMIAMRAFNNAACSTIGNTVELPLKKQSKAGYYYSTCGLHYRKEVESFVNADGTMKSEAECVEALEKLMNQHLTTELIAS